MMLRPLIALLLLLALARCGEVLPPFQSVPLPAKPEPGATPTRVGVCYNALTTTREAVVALAREGCPAGTEPTPAESDVTLNNCPLLTPTRETFACTKP